MIKKKVLIISSSPRKQSNSEILCDEFMKGAREAGNTVEKLRIADMNITFCSGCDECTKYQRSCPQNDDIALVEKKMIEAQVVVLATPTYFYMMSGQMKTFLDRACSYYQKMQDTEFYYIVTSADDRRRSIDDVVSGFRGFVNCIDGAVEKGIIYATDVWEMGDVKTKEAMEQSYEMGKKV